MTNLYIFNGTLIHFNYILIPHPVYLNKKLRDEGMQSNHRRIVLQQRVSKMNRKILFLILIAACTVIPVAYFLILCAINPSPEVLNDQIRQVEAAISENEAILGKLAFHERRLSSAAGNSQSYRLPVLVEGKSTYVTFDASELDEVSNSLALEDLMIKHHRKLKGNFHSGNAAEWNSILLEISQESKNHLRTTELPAIQKRMEEIQQETTKLELRRASLQEKISRVTH